MSAMREKDKADFDLEQFLDMFDQAMTSDDSRVQNALRQLMMLVILTDTRDPARKTLQDKNQGPLRRMYDDLYRINRTVSDLKEEVYALRTGQGQISRAETPYNLAQAGPQSQKQAQAIKPAVQYPAAQYDPSARLHGHK